MPFITLLTRVRTHWPNRKLKQVSKPCPNPHGALDTSDSLSSAPSLIPQPVDTPTPSSISFGHPMREVPQPWFSRRRSSLFRLSAETLKLNSALRNIELKTTPFASSTDASTSATAVNSDGIEMEMCEMLPSLAYSSPLLGNFSYHDDEDRDFELRNVILSPLPVCGMSLPTIAASNIRNQDSITTVIHARPVPVCGMSLPNIAASNIHSPDRFYTVIRAAHCEGANHPVTNEDKCNTPYFIKAADPAVNDDKPSPSSPRSPFRLAHKKASLITSNLLHSLQHFRPRPKPVPTQMPTPLPLCSSPNPTSIQAPVQPKTSPLRHNRPKPLHIPFSNHIFRFTSTSTSTPHHAKPLHTRPSLPTKSQLTSTSAFTFPSPSPSLSTRPSYHRLCTVSHTPLSTRSIYTTPASAISINPAAHHDRPGTARSTRTGFSIGSIGSLGSIMLEWWK